MIEEAKIGAVVAAAAMEKLAAVPVVACPHGLSDDSACPNWVSHAGSPMFPDARRVLDRENTIRSW